MATRALFGGSRSGKGRGSYPSHQKGRGLKSEWRMSTGMIGMNFEGTRASAILPQCSNSCTIGLNGNEPGRTLTHVAFAQDPLCKEHHSFSSKILEGRGDHLCRSGRFIASADRSVSGTGRLETPEHLAGKGHLPRIRARLR